MTELVENPLASNDTGPDAPPSQPPRRGSSTGRKVAVGCGIAALVGLGSSIAVGIILWRFAAPFMPGKFVEDFEEQGYAIAESQAATIGVNQVIADPTVYFVQSMTFEGRATTDLAIYAQNCSITGTIEGNLDFLGQVLTIEAGGLVKGDVRVRAAQAITVSGTIEGSIEGGMIQVVAVEKGGSVGGQITGKIQVITRSEE